MTEILITRPDDWHLHLRDSPYMESVVAATAKQFARAIIMPNLKPPVTRCEHARAYRQRILDALPADSAFDPLMTLYLTDNTRVEDIIEASDSDTIFGAKLYPAGATTNSDDGVTDLSKLYAVFEAMQKHRFVLQVHGEVTDPDIDIFDREKVFIDTKLSHIRRDFPELRIVLEHVTTRDAVQFVSESNDHMGATITPHHLMINRNAMFSGGIRPHHYCLPVAKREMHRQALVAAAISGDQHFFAGTDSAPHARGAKESSCGCAGIYSAHCAVELYTEVFDSQDALHRLEGFMSHYGPRFYDLPVNQDEIVLRKSAWTIPDVLAFHDTELVPFKAGEALSWQVVYDD